MPKENTLKKLIFHIPKWYPSRLEPLHGIFVQRHVNAVNKVNKSVVLYAQVDSTLKGNKIIFEDSEIEGVPTYYAFYAKRILGIPGLDTILKARLYFKAMHVLFKKASETYGKPTLLHVHVLVRTGIFARSIKKRLNIPFVITEHWSIYSAKQLRIPALKHFWMKRVFKEAKATTAVNKNLLNAISDRHGFHSSIMKVIPNVVSPDTFNLENKPPRSHPYHLLHVSELVDSVKNFSGILAAIELLSKTRNDFVLDIIGYGAEEELLKSKLTELGPLADQVKFHGRKTGKELADFYKKASAFILFSRYENQPCVILEALACGTPVISSNVGGVADMVDQTQGILVENGDVTALSEAIDTLLNKLADFDPQELNSSIATTYFDEAIGHQFDKIYDA